MQWFSQINHTKSERLFFFKLFTRSLHLIGCYFLDAPRTCHRFSQHVMTHPFQVFSLEMRISCHRPNLPNNTGGTKSTITNFNLRRSLFIKGGKIGLHQSVIYVRPFSPTFTPGFYLFLFKSVPKKIYIYVYLEKMLGRGHLPPPCPLPSSYAYVSRGSAEIFVMKQ